MPALEKSSEVGIMSQITLHASMCVLFHITPTSATPSVPPVEDEA